MVKLTLSEEINICVCTDITTGKLIFKIHLIKEKLTEGRGIIITDFYSGVFVSIASLPLKIISSRFILNSLELN